MDSFWKTVDHCQYYTVQEKVRIFFFFGSKEEKDEPQTEHSLIKCFIKMIIFIDNG